MSDQPLLMGPSLDEAIDEALGIVRDAKERFPHVATVCLFSGGNDSTVLLHLCKEIIDFALHINTGIGIERTREFVRATTTDWDVPLREEKTDPSWYREQVLAHGFPGPMGHNVMYHNLKRNRLDDVKRDLSQKRGDCLLLLTGERAYESNRRARYGHDTVRKEKGHIWANPIKLFTNWHMGEYRKRFDLPKNPASALMHKSGECLCGAFAHPGELAELEIWFPETASYIRDLEHQAEEAGHGKRAKWAWGNDRRNALQKAPGAMCSSCHQLALEETA